MRVNKLGDPLVLAYVIDGFGFPLYLARPGCNTLLREGLES